MFKNKKTTPKITLIVVLCVFTFLGLVSCNSNDLSENQDAVQTCNIDKYKNNAMPLMQDFSDIVQELQIRDATSRAETKRDLESLLDKMNYVKCKDDFPLKHETLEYSVKHMIDAIDYADEGDYEQMNFSINKSLLNVETFQDWTIDID